MKFGYTRMVPVSRRFLWVSIIFISTRCDYEKNTSQQVKQRSSKEKIATPKNETSFFHHVHVIFSLVGEFNNNNISDSSVSTSLEKRAKAKRTAFVRRNTRSGRQHNSLLYVTHTASHTIPLLHTCRASIKNHSTSLRSSSSRSSRLLRGQLDGRPAIHNDILTVQERRSAIRNLIHHVRNFERFADPVIDVRVRKVFR